MQSSIDPDFVFASEISGRIYSAGEVPEQDFQEPHMPINLSIAAKFDFENPDEQGRSQHWLYQESDHAYVL